MKTASIRDRFFSAWANAVTDNPWLVLAVCTIVAAGSVYLTVSRLQFHSDRSELIDPSLPWQQRYADFKARFPRWDDAVIVVDMDSAGSAEHAEAYLAALEARLRADPHHWAVTAGFAQAEAPAALLLTEPLEHVKSVVAQMKQATVVLTSPSLEALLGLTSLAGANLPEANRVALRGMLERAAAAGTAPPETAGQASVLGLNGGMQRLVTRSGKLATVLVGLKSASADPGVTGGAAAPAKGVNDNEPAIAAIRAHLAALREEPRFAGVQCGVTGVPVLESDETAQSTRDGEHAGYLSLGLIVVLMLFAYRGVAVPLMATVSLLIGIAWSFAWATLAVGHLQLLSVVFASFLLGLGIDVAIHIIARLELVHPEHNGLGPAIAQAFRGVGPGIITATLTVAAAAGTMALTSFSGVAEMGIIAAGGVILCTISVMCFLPALLMIVPGAKARLRSRLGGESGAFLGRADELLHARPLPIVIVGAGLLALAAWFGAGARYDPNIQNLLPRGVESAIWQDRLEADDAKSVWHAVVLADSTEQARELTLKLRALPLVSDVGGAGMLFQTDADIKAKQSLLQTLPDEHFVKTMMDGAESNPGALRGAVMRIAKTFQGKDDGLAAAAQSVAALDDTQLSRVHDQYTNDRENLAGKMLELHSAEPVQPESLPGALKDLMIGEGGSLLLRIYPTEVAAAPGASKTAASLGVLSKERLEPFAQAVLAVAPNATGPSIQIYESTNLITSAYRQAAIYALIAIFALLLLDFRSITDALCAMLPVVFGAALMLAVMRFAGVELNFANLIVMPLIVGIGVGCGVHAVRRWRMQPHDSPPGLAGGSGRAITLTSMTTMIGFATLMIGQHRGIRSLGFVMSLGLGMVWVVTIFVLPAVLKLRTQRTTEPMR